MTTAKVMWYARALCRPNNRCMIWRNARARFGEAVIDFANIIPRTAVTRRLIEQLVGCGTSVGANYCEADDAVSKKEFRLRCGTWKKEARETKYFLRMVVRVLPELKSQARLLWQEAKELHLIFAKIWRSAQ